MTELFLKTFNLSISAGWLVLVVLALRVLLRRAPKWINVLLWAMVALRLVCPFSIESALSLIPSAQTVSPEIMMAQQPTINTGILVVDGRINPMIMYSAAPAPGASVNPLQIWIPAAAVVWLTGTGALLLYAAVSYWRLRRRVDTAVLLRGNIYQSEYVSSPFVLGIIRAKIYLPFSMSEEAARYVVAHEKAHIRRRDHWWKPLGFLLLAIHWFNPLMWLAYNLLCRDIELACDEAVIKRLDNERRAAYASALLGCSVKRPAVAACPIAFGEVGVKARVRSVMNYKKPAFWVILGALILCLAVAVCFLTDPKQQEPQTEAPVLPGISQEEPTELVEEDASPQEAVSDLAYFVELAMPGTTFRDMDPQRQKEILSEYGDLLEGHTLLARETGDGGLFYIAAYFGGDPEADPFAALSSHVEDSDTGTVQQIFSGDRQDLEEDHGRYTIHNSFIHHSKSSRFCLIHPMDALWGLSDVYNRYVAPNGRAYMLDAAARGIALATPEGPYLEICLISEKWGQVVEMVPLTQEQALEILAEDRIKLDEGYGFGAALYNGTASNLELDWDEGQFTAFLGVPQTVLDLAVEKCGYQFASPEDIQGTIVEARLDCSWLEEPLYAGEADLARLQSILANAEYDFVGACGYGAKLTIQMSDGSSMVLFKGTDGCDTMVFGSYGGYVIGDAENVEFWNLFGLDADTKEPMN